MKRILEIAIGGFIGAALLWYVAFRIYPPAQMSSSQKTTTITSSNIDSQGSHAYELPTKSTQQSNTTIMEAQKQGKTEEAFIKLLDDSLASEDLENIIRAIDILGNMRSNKFESMAINALIKCYPHVTSYTSDINRRVCISCINALVAINANNACRLFQEIQARQPNLSDIPICPIPVGELRR